MATRKEMIDKLAKEDAQILVALQGKCADNIVKEIEAFDDATYDITKQLREMTEDRFNKWAEKSGYAEELAKFEKKKEEYLQKDFTDEKQQEAEGIVLDKEEEKLNNKYHPKEKRETIETQVEKEVWGTDKKRFFVNQRCGMGNQELPYCIALQNQAMNEAVEEAKALGINSVSSMKESLGWGCVNAEAKFTRAGYGNIKDISSLYTLPTGDREHCVVKNGKDGEPVVKDGDIALLRKNGSAYHAVRLNVDDKGEVTYTAGNSEQDHMRVSYISRERATIIPMSDYVQAQAQQYYQSMSDEQLKAIIQSRENDASRAELRAAIKAQQATPVNNPVAKIQTDQFDKRLALRINTEVNTKDLETANVVDSRNIPPAMLLASRGGR